MSENKVSDIFTDHVQMVNKPTHISESLIDHVYIKKNLMEKSFTNAAVGNIYVSDHDSVRIVIEETVISSAKKDDFIDFAAFKWP